MRLRTLIPACALLLVASCASKTAPTPAVLVPSPPIAVPNPPSARAEVTSDKPFHPAVDIVADDSAIGPGTVRVTVLDADGEPIPHAPITLETVLVHAPSNGLDVIAKDTAVADEKGTATFRKVRSGGGERQVVSSRRGDGDFALEPFTMNANAGKRVTLHAYETVRDLEHALVVIQAATALHVRADAIEIEVLYHIINIGRVAWVPSNVRVTFPPAVSQFLASDLGLPVRADDITTTGFALTGTVAPGEHDLEYHYQIPRERSRTQRIVLNLPPRVIHTRVLLDASGPAQLTVAGFPSAEKTTPKSGPAMLMTERKMTATEGALKSLDITVAGDPI